MNSPLFEPMEMAGLQLRNRVAMAPMTRARALDGGMPVPLMAEYYEQRSEAGLLVSEAVNVSEEASGFPGTPGIFTAAQALGWRPVVERVHQAGGVFFMQIWHVGRIAHPDNMPNGLHPVAPSAIAHDRTVVTRNGLQQTPTPRALTLDDIVRTVADFGRAAGLAVEAGCDGIEIHAANGYLASQFLHETTNSRSDAYGGSLQRRARFVVEIAEACAGAIGGSRVGIRVAPFSTFNGAQSRDDAEVYRHLLPELARLDLAYLHTVSATIAGNRSIEPTEGSPPPDVLGFVRPIWPHALIAAGDYTLQSADADIRAGRADLIAFGRDFISNPDLVSRLRQGLPLVPRNPPDWYGEGAEGYTTYPRWTPGTPE